ncbi:hypothetical protein KAI87_01430, partial [Myxococcota bacterium]|nr:hypothetical protein [Myxococcota bacterium]
MNLSVVILTGQSGSGKSTAVAALEDQDYYCVDNLPVTLAEDLIDLIDGEPEIKDLALVMDARGPKFAQHGPDLIRKLRKNKVSLRLIYLETAEE